MHALSSNMSRNTPGSPIVSMTLTAKLTSGSVMEARSAKRSSLAAGVPPVPLFATSLESHHEALTAALARVVPTERFILGPEVEAFEAEFAAYLGVGHCVGVANGTDALTIALRALGVQPGDEVVLPSLTFYATAEATVNAGAEPVFCDVDPVTCCVTADTIEPALTERTRAIVPVHLF